MEASNAISLFGEIFIPKKADKLSSIKQLFSLMYDSFRNILHQGELLTLFLVIKLKSNVEGNIDFVEFSQQLDIYPSISSQVQDKASDSTTQETAISYRFYESNFKFDVMPTTSVPISEDPDIESYPNHNFCVTKMFYIKSEKLSIYEIQIPIHIERRFLLQELNLIIKISHKKLKNYSKIINFSFKEDNLADLVSSKGDSQITFTKEIKKIVKVIQPLVFASAISQYNSQYSSKLPSYFLNFQIRNATNEHLYSDSSLKHSRFLQNIHFSSKENNERGEDSRAIRITNIKFDLSKALVFFNDEKRDYNYDMMMFLRHFAHEFFNINILTNDHMPIILEEGDEYSFVIRISQLKQLPQNMTRIYKMVCQKCHQKQIIPNINEPPLREKSLPEKRENSEGKSRSPFAIKSKLNKSTEMLKSPFRLRKNKSTYKDTNEIEARKSLSSRSHHSNDPIKEKEPQSPYMPEISPSKFFPKNELDEISSSKQTCKCLDVTVNSLVGNISTNLLMKLESGYTNKGLEFEFPIQWNAFLPPPVLVEASAQLTDATNGILIIRVENNTTKPMKIFLKIVEDDHIYLSRNNDPKEGISANEYNLAIMNQQLEYMRKDNPTVEGKNIYPSLVFLQKNYPLGKVEPQQKKRAILQIHFLREGIHEINNLLLFEEISRRTLKLGLRFGIFEK